jgi:signal transduction histidine kinase
MRALRAAALGLALVLAAPAEAATRVRAGLYENSPKVGLSAAGKPEGIFVDILEVIAREEGWDLEWVPGTWSEGLARLEAGEIDLMPDVAPIGEREAIFAFNREPVLSSWNQVFARKGSGIRALPGLEGRRVAVLEDSIQERQFLGLVKSFGMDVAIEALPDFASAFRAVAEGRADAVVTNRFYGVRHAAAAGLEDTAIIFSPTALHFAAPRGADRAVLDAIDRRLVTLKRDPGSPYYAALRRWTSDGVAPGLPPWVSWAAAAAFALLAVSLAWGLTLRRAAVRLRESERHQRLLTEELRSRAEALERTAAALAEARDAAQSADRLKSAFLATMSHELRTPLNAIIGFTGIILKGMAGPLTPEQARQLGMVQAASRHLLALINDVLDISKIEAGELRVAAEPFDLAASVARVAATIAPLAQKKGLALEVGAVPPGEAVGDARRVEQVLLNLLGNAVKFTEAGSVTLTAEPVADHRPREGDAPVAAVRLRVADTGVGIAPEDMAKLFQPFRQVDSTLARKHEGTGLGLAICRRLAGLMGGRVDAESRPGEGSVFTFTLPLAPPAPPALPEAP